MGAGLELVSLLETTSQRHLLNVSLVLYLAHSFQMERVVKRITWTSQTDSHRRKLFGT